MARETPAAPPVWAPRVPHKLIRELYARFAEGECDGALLRAVGSGLSARAKDVIHVSVAVRTGVVACPTCGAGARRVRRRIHTPPGDTRPVVCPGCGYSTGWQRLRDALREHPVCLKCHQPMQWSYAEGSIACPDCGTPIAFLEWTRRLRRRRTLPCPRCGAGIAKPDAQPRQSHAPRPTEETSCAHCGVVLEWSAVRAHWRSHPTCACGAPLERDGETLACSACGRAWSARRFSTLLAERRTGPCPTCGERLARTPDVVRCGACGGEWPWSRFRRGWQGHGLMTGAGVPACERFVTRWARAREPMDQMLAIDAFLHKLHYGPLAPLLVEGSRGAVLAMLDEFAGTGPIRPPTPAPGTAR